MSLENVNTPLSPEESEKLLKLLKEESYNIWNHVMASADELAIAVSHKFEFDFSKLETDWNPTLTEFSEQLSQLKVAIKGLLELYTAIDDYEMQRLMLNSLQQITCIEELRNAVQIADQALALEIHKKIQSQAKI